MGVLIIHIENVSFFRTWLEMNDENLSIRCHFQRVDIQYVLLCDIKFNLLVYS